MWTCIYSSHLHNRLITLKIVKCKLCMFLAEECKLSLSILFFMQFRNVELLKGLLEFNCTILNCTSSFFSLSFIHFTLRVCCKRAVLLFLLYLHKHESLAKTKKLHNSKVFFSLNVTKLF